MRSERRSSSSRAAGLSFSPGSGLIALAEAVLAVSGPSGVSPARAALGLVGLAILGAVTVVFVRRPELVPLAILVAAPLRMPLDFGAAHRFYVGLPQDGEIGRLLPLYGFIVAAALALAWRLVRNPAANAASSTARDRGSARGARRVRVALRALVDGRRRGAEPAAVLPPPLRRARRRRRAFAVPRLDAARARLSRPSRWRRSSRSSASIEEATQRLIFYTPSVQIGNAYSNFFRVTSLFRDPSLYGRQIVLAMAIVLTAMWYRKIGMLLASLVTVFLFAGLFFSYSQSSLVALFAVAVFISVVAGDRAVRLVAAITAVVVLAGGGAFVADKVAGASTQRVTSDRSRRIDLTVKVIRHHPLVGVGLGSQPKASQAVSKNGGPPSLFVSHTTPLTVFAELGIVGLLLYAALLLGAAKALLRAFRLDNAFGLALASVFAALFVHSLFYSGFFEDPVTWLVLGVASSFLIARSEPKAETAA